VQRDIAGNVIQDGLTSKHDRLLVSLIPPTMGCESVYYKAQEAGQARLLTSRRIIATWIQASLRAGKNSSSSLRRRERPSQANVLATTQRRGMTLKVRGGLRAAQSIVGFEKVVLNSPTLSHAPQAHHCA
jgi:hypothetical protein